MSPPEPSVVALLVGNTIQFVEVDVSLVSDDDGLRWRAAIREDAELGAGAELEIIRGPGGTKAHLRTNGVVATSFDELELVKRTFPVEDGELELLGVQGSFSFPHRGPFRHLRTVFLGTQDDEVLHSLATALGATAEDESDEADNITRLPWTLESLTRFSAAHARALPTVDQVDVVAPGQLRLQCGEDVRHVDIHNLFLDVSAAPEAAQEKIARFFAATRPSASSPVETSEIMLRVMTGSAPVRLEVLIEGKTKLIELASLGVADDLAAVFVRDTPESMAYLNASEVGELGLGLDELAEVARANLLRNLSTIHIRGEGPTYMLIAGGNYECSLALLPDLWDAMAPLIEGAPLVSMLARDLCLITGDGNPDAVARLRAQIESMGELPYAISPTIYRVQRQGRWFEPLA